MTLMVHCTCNQLICQTLKASFVPNYHQHTLAEHTFHDHSAALSQAKSVHSTAVQLLLPIHVCPGVRTWHPRTQLLLVLCDHVFKLVMSIVHVVKILWGTNSCG